MDGPVKWTVKLKFEWTFNLNVKQICTNFNSMFHRVLHFFFGEESSKWTVKFELWWTLNLKI